MPPLRREEPTLQQWDAPALPFACMQERGPPQIGHSAPPRPLHNRGTCSSPASRLPARMGPPQRPTHHHHYCPATLATQGRVPVLRPRPLGHAGCAPDCAAGGRLCRSGSHAGPDPLLSSRYHRQGGAPAHCRTMQHVTALPALVCGPPTHHLTWFA